MASEPSANFSFPAQLSRTIRHPPAMATVLATAAAAAAHPTTTTATCCFSHFSQVAWVQRMNTRTFGMKKPKVILLMTPLKFERRRTLICAANQDAEESFKKTVEVDRLIDTLRVANENELQRLVVENILAFNESFWIRLAARTDTCKSNDDKKDYEELAVSLMSIVDCVVHKTKEKIESATDILEEILKPVMDEVEEITWPPRDLESLGLMEKELEHREREGQLDEGFLSEVNAQLRQMKCLEENPAILSKLGDINCCCPDGARGLDWMPGILLGDFICTHTYVQAKEDGDKPGLQAMLQKVLQLYASKVLSKRSYAYKGKEVLKAEKFLELIIQAPEEDWNRLLISGLTLGKGEVSPEEFYTVLKKRIERTLIRTEGGSYQQRVLTEYLRGIESRTKEVVQALQGQQQ